jgi:D-amino peptidase
MVGDINAAIDGILSVYPDAEITVCDGHGGMNNIVPSDLNKKAVLVRGSPKPLSQVAGIDESYDALLFVGYHSKKGTKHGVMSHTYSGRSIESLTVNGKIVGETGMNAGIAGHFGVPLIFVAGDLATTLEAKELIPEIGVAAVKEAIGRTAAKCLHPEVAQELIRENVTKAMKKKIQPYVYETPVTIQVRFTDAKKADAASIIPTAERLDGKTIQFVTEDYLKAFNAFVTSVLCAQAVS